MDMWILLAAAGSGYLARCWQNAHKSKDTCAEDDEHRDGGISHNSLSETNRPPSIPAARKYRRFSPTGKHRIGKSFSSKYDWGLANRHLMKNLQVDENSIPSLLPDVKRGHGQSSIVSAHSLDQGRQVSNLQNGDITLATDRGEVKLDVGSEISVAKRINKTFDTPVEHAGKAKEGFDCHLEPGNDYGLAVIPCNSQAGFMRVVDGNDMFDNVASEENSLSQSLPVREPSQCELDMTQGRRGTNNGKQVLTVQTSEMSCLRDAFESFQLGERSFAGKRSNDHVREESFKDGQLVMQGVPGKRMKDVVEKEDIGEQVILGFNFESGFSELSQSLFGYDTFGVLTQQKKGKRSKGSNSRRSKTPNKSSRSGYLTNRNKQLTTNSKPMPSLESCLSAQLILDNNDKGSRGEFCPLISVPVTGRGEQAMLDDICKKGDNSFNVLTKAMQCSSRDDTAACLPGADCIIGLPPLSSHGSGNSSKNRTGKANVDITNAPSHGQNACPRCEQGDEPIKTAGTSRETAVQKRGKVCEHCNHVSCSLNGLDEGLLGSSPQGHLFNFGVGVGVLFMIMSKRKGLMDLTQLLRQTQDLVKDLQKELEGETLSVRNDKVVNLSGAASEVRQVASFDSFMKESSLSQSLSSTKLPVTEGYGFPVTLEPRQSNDMTKLEAELEAELERMELNLDGQGNPHHQKTFSGSSEIDPDIIANVVNGELTVRGLPFEADLDSEEDGSLSTNEEMNISNYTVSPRELERHLHEVLEARQEERISELEAELDAMRGRLQAREQELEWWKNQVFPGTDVSLRSSSSGSVDGDQTSLLLSRTEHNSSFCKESLQRCVEMKGELRGSLNGEDSLHFAVEADYSPSLGSVSHDIDEENFVHESEDAKAAPMALVVHGVGKTEKMKKVPSDTNFTGDAEAVSSEACNAFLKVLDNSKLGINVITGKPGNCNDSIPLVDYLVDEALVSSLKKVIDHDNGGCVPLFEHSEELTVANNCRNGTDKSSQGKLNMLLESVTGFGANSVSLNKEIAVSHLEPEQNFMPGNMLNGCIDPANDIMGNTLCSVKCMDVRMLSMYQNDNLTYPSNRSNADTAFNDNNDCLFLLDKVVISHAGENMLLTGSQAESHSFPIGQGSFQGRPFQSLEVKSVDETNCWDSNDILMEDERGSKTLEKSDDSSDSDESICKLLINQIVEKTRRGSPIVQDAQTILASLERDESFLSSHLSSINYLDSMLLEEIGPYKIHSFAGRDGESVPVSHAIGQSTVLGSAHPLNKSGDILTRQEIIQSKLAVNNDFFQEPLDICSFPGSLEELERGHKHASQQ